MKTKVYAIINMLLQVVTRYARLSLISHLNEGIYHLRFLLVFLSPNSAFYVSFIFRDFKAY